MLDVGDRRARADRFAYDGKDPALHGFHHRDDLFHEIRPFRQVHTQIRQADPLHPQLLIRRPNDRDVRKTIVAEIAYNALKAVEIEPDLHVAEVSRQDAVVFRILDEMAR
ncbi:MAG: hypothetical protein NTU83_00965 [Candidatus Hydrogenedentes bacterium]|nr:hypothetical protein [Candidatus Hydrogenedentota bacterium]